MNPQIISIRMYHDIFHDTMSLKPQKSLHLAESLKYTMEKFKVTAGMLFSLECEVTAESHQEAVERMMGFIEAAYKDEAIYDEVNGTEFIFIRPTTLIVEDNDGNTQDFQFSE